MNHDPQLGSTPFFVAVGFSPCFLEEGQHPVCVSVGDSNHDVMIRPQRVGCERISSYDVRRVRSARQSGTGCVATRQRSRILIARPVPEQDVTGKVSRARSCRRLRHRGQTHFLFAEGDTVGNREMAGGL
jgi:hypothetical protein